MDSYETHQLSVVCVQSRIGLQGSKQHPIPATPCHTSTARPVQVALCRGGTAVRLPINDTGGYRPTRGYLALPCLVTRDA